MWTHPHPRLPSKGGSSWLCTRLAFYLWHLTIWLRITLDRAEHEQHLSNRDERHTPWTCSR